MAAAVRRRRLLPSQLRPRGAEPPPHRAPASAAPAPGRAGREWRPGCGGAPQPRCHTDEAARDVPPRPGPPRALSQCPGPPDTLSHRAGALRRCHSALSPSSTLSHGHVPCRHGVAGPCPTKQRLYLWANSRCTPYPQTQPQHPYLGLPCPRDTLVLSNPVDILWGFGFCDTQRWHLLVSGALLAASLSKGSVDKPNMLWRCSVQFGVGFVSAEGFPTKASSPTAWPKLLQDHPNDHFYLSSPSSTVGLAILDSARS